jgi:site-specific DNA-methyltransferase (adenine-specific)
MILKNGDCLDEMKNIQNESIDLILCDLPYGTISCSWDVIIPFDLLWKEYKRIIKPNGNVVLFSSQPFTTDLIMSNRKDFKYCLVWEKNVPTGMTSAKSRPMKYHEDVCIFNFGKAKYNPIMKDRVGVGKACYNYEHYAGASNHITIDKKPKKYDPNFVNPSTILKFNVVPNRVNKLHPTQKPVELLEYLIKTYSDESDLVLDNCMGSGSTGEACIKTNRSFFGIEKELDYFEIAKKRLEGMKRRYELFPS